MVSIDESPDGREVLTASRDGTIRIWPREAVTEAFVESLVLSGDSGTIGEIDFSPDGTRLVSAGENGKMKVWDTATGQEQLTIHLARTKFPTG